MLSCFAARAGDGPPAMSLRAAETVSGSSGGRPGARPRFLASSRGGVEALLEAHQVDTSGLEGVNGFEQLAQQLPQAVEPGDAEAIPTKRHRKVCAQDYGNGATGASWMALELRARAARCTSGAGMSRVGAFKIIKRRARKVGLLAQITEYLRHGGDLEVAARIARHEATRTIQLYNRLREQVSLDELE